MKSATMLDARFSYAMAKLGAFEPSALLAIAVSGGSDSMALLRLTHDWAKSKKATIIALTVDHRLRKESAEEAKQVKSWCKKFGIEHYTLTSQEPIPNENIQDWARELRYSLMTNFCKERFILHLLVAHQLQDQAETLLQRLARGSGAAGLAGIYPEIHRNHVRILRPLLGFARPELQAYLNSIKQDWCEDASNAKTDYGRNKLRLALKETLGDDALLEQRIAGSATHLQATQRCITKELARLAAEHLEIYPFGAISADRNEFLQLPNELLPLLISRILACIGGNTSTPRQDSIDELIKQVQKPSFKGATLAGVEILADKDILYFFRETASKSPFPFELHAPKGFILKPLGQKNYLQVSKLKCRLPNVPKRILYTIPAVYSTKSLENALACPHIGYYGDKRLKTAVSIRFTPEYPLFWSVELG